jgi:hypothetical protein
MVLTLGGTGLSKAQTLDVSTKTWSKIPVTGATAEHATPVQLDDGSILAVGGRTPAPTAVDSASIFNPSTGVWSSASPMNMARSRPIAIQLADGRILVYGGYQFRAGKIIRYAERIPVGTSEVFDPKNGTWSP